MLQRIVYVTEEEEKDAEAEANEGSLVTVTSTTLFLCLCLIARRPHGVLVSDSLSRVQLEPTVLDRESARYRSLALRRRPEAVYPRVAFKFGELTVRDISSGANRKEFVGSGGAVPDKVCWNRFRSTNDNEFARSCGVNDADALNVVDRLMTCEILLNVRRV